MSSAQSPRVLLTGATGFIGGTILTHLLEPTSEVLKSAIVTCLVRGDDRAATLVSTYGDRVRPIVYKDLDDIEATTAAAAQNDLVINTTLGYHSASAQALLHGLAKRKESTGRDVWMIHTSGASNLADEPISRNQAYNIPDHDFDDSQDDVYEYEKQREGITSYPQRSTELGVVDEGLKLGVKTLVIMSPTIYGIGSGVFNKTSIQLPTYIRCVLEYGRAVVIGSGSGQWDHVHVEDLADLYTIIAVEILENSGRALPSGKKGIIFSGNGRHSWMEVAQEVANACFEQGKIPENRVESVDLSEGTKILSSYLGDADESTTEVGLASNSKTVSSVARSLGWKPTRGEAAWKRGFRDDVRVLLEADS